VRVRFFLKKALFDLRFLLKGSFGFRV